MILFPIPDLANLSVLTLNYDFVFVFTEVSSVWFCYLLLLSSWELLLPWWPCKESLREMEKSSPYVPLQHSGTQIMIGNVLYLRLLHVLIWIFILKNSEIKLRSIRQIFCHELLLVMKHARVLWEPFMKDTGKSQV